ncbi:MAG: heavy metal translocating P-type ATPase metal-binding domain-containing protein [Bacteroidota bacterium]|nr:heavy metal translocating P-type ATPase metal-binding domain-containing protein [Bacteroidota bacterium]
MIFTGTKFFFIKTSVKAFPTCFHCGDDCTTLIIKGEKNFCCEGCKQVYLLLNENNLCSYYNFEKNPGIKVKGKFLNNRFDYLDDDAVIQKLISFRSDSQTNVSFLLPQMHCSSCIFLLENLHRINPGITSSQTNFQRKEVFISYNETLISLREVVELLAFIGYEPFISLSDSGQKKDSKFDRKQIFKIGVAGFCFSNIMMLSFPEYFSGGIIEEHGLKETFSWIIFGLSLPVLFYSASDIFRTAFKGLQQKSVNIDAPIALAIIITFCRSYYEIITGTGAGYLDSGSGIIFFILIGRWFQNKTYEALSFDRDYQSYFPLGVTVLRNKKEVNIPATKLCKGDIIVVKNEEMVPADAVLVNGQAFIDYSFVSGENIPLTKSVGDIIYAGGKQIGASLKLQVVKESSQSYITRLWNNEVFGKSKNAAKSFIHPWSRYFTTALFIVATGAAIFWYLNDPSKIWPVITSVLIVACPCSLLLSATFTFGNMQRIFGKHKLFLKNATVIETLAGIDTIVFDKTGTITQSNIADIKFTGEDLTLDEKLLLKKITAQSSHTYSKLITSSFEDEVMNDEVAAINDFKEYAGKGISATVNNIPVKVGAPTFINKNGKSISKNEGSRVHVMIGDSPKGYFEIQNKYREGFEDLVRELHKSNYEMHVLSGDNDAERQRLREIFNSKSSLCFNASPQDKLDYIKKLQDAGKKVLMIGDGLNDSGALMQSNVGIAVSNNAARFTPACDAIIDGEAVYKTARFIDYAKAGKKVVAAGFALSILYNFIGLSFAVQGKLDPVVAAILMPASSISIVALASLLSSFVARLKKL